MVFIFCDRSEFCKRKQIFWWQVSCVLGKYRGVFVLPTYCFESTIIVHWPSHGHHLIEDHHLGDDGKYEGLLNLLDSLHNKSIILMSHECRQCCRDAHSEFISIWCLWRCLVINIQQSYLMNSSSHQVQSNCLSTCILNAVCFGIWVLKYFA